MLLDAEALKPYEWCHGPLLRNTYTVDIPHRVIFDVNLFYRRLGVDPHASKLEIRRRHQAVGLGDPDLTYIVKRLVQDDVRWRYDAMIPGEYMFDKWIERSVLDQVIAEARRAVALGLVDEDEMDENPTDLSELRDQVVDLNDERRKNKRLEYRRPLYEWRAHMWQAVPNIELLQQWQVVLLEALSDHKETVEFAIGLAGEHMECPLPIVEEGPSYPIAYLGDESEPTPEAAQVAVRQLMMKSRLTLRRAQ